MNPNHIRTACRADTEMVTCLVNRAYRPKSGMSGWTSESGIMTGDRTTKEPVSIKTRQAGSVVFVAIQDHEIVVCIHIERCTKASHFGMLAVNPAPQSQGTGKLVLAQAEEHSTHNFDAVKFAVTVISSRIEPVSFYLRFDYQKVGFQRPYPLSTGARKPVHLRLAVERLEIIYSPT